MNTIHKYHLVVTDHQEIVMPEGAKILTAQLQNDDLVLWAAVDTRQYKVDRVIKIYGTGNPADVATTATYIATVQTKIGLVWHIFDDGELPF